MITTMVNDSQKSTKKKTNRIHQFPSLQLLSIAGPSPLTAIDRYVRAGFAVHQFFSVWDKLLCGIKIDAVGHRSFIIATALQNNKLILVLAPVQIVQFTLIQ